MLYIGNLWVKDFYQIKVNHIEMICWYFTDNMTQESPFLLRKNILFHMIYSLKVGCSIRKYLSPLLYSTDTSWRILLFVLFILIEKSVLSQSLKNTPSLVLPFLNKLCAGSNPNLFAQSLFKDIALLDGRPFKLSVIE